MGRTAIVSRLVEDQLQNYSTEKKLSWGLLIGQPNVDGKDYLIYAVKTPIQSDPGTEKAEGVPNAKQPASSIQDLDPQLLVNHAVVMTRMIPGSFFVQGIFVVSEDDVFEEELASKKVRQCVLEINKIISDNMIFQSSTQDYDKNEKLIMHCTPQGQPTCRSFSITDPSAAFKPVEWITSDKATQWYLFETNYDLDEVFPLSANEQVVNMEENFLLSLKSINSYLDRSSVFIQQDQYEDSIPLDTLLKTKREKKEKIDVFKSSVFFPTSVAEVDMSTIVQVHGTMRYNGIVFSRVWAHPQTTLADIKRYIRNDILRSLAARIQLYCDSLTEPNVHEGAFIVSEPPRRVFIKIAGAGGIEFSEYLFRGEMADVVVEQAKEMLDLQITAEDVEMELEALPMYEEDTSTLSEVSFSTSRCQVTRQDVRRNMYVVGILGALAILILSLVIHLLGR